MDEVGFLQLAIMLKTPKTPIMAPKEVARKGPAMWPTIFKTYPIMKVGNTVTYKTILIVTSMAWIYRIGLMNTVLDAHII